MTLEQLKVIISADASGFNKEMNKVQKSLSGLNSLASQSSSNLNAAFKSMKKAFSATAIIAGLTTLGKKAVETASDLVEVQNVVDTAFGSMASDVDSFAKNAMTQFGLSELAAKKYSSTLMAMGNSMKISTKSAKTMAVQLTGLSADLASFYNTDVDTAFNALEGIYTGNTRALRQYGVVLSEVELQQYATAKGITKSVSDMSSAEAATLRYNYVLEHTTQAQNDFAKTNMTWANSLKIVSNQITELGSVVGTILKTVLVPFVNMLHLILQYAITAAKALAKLFGISLNFSSGGSVDDLATGWGDVADSTNDATEAAKKYNKQLAKFDEINNLNTNESDSGSGSGLSNLGGGGFDVGSYFDDTNMTLENFDFDFNSWLQEVNDWLLQYKETIAAIGTTIGEKINELVDYIDWDLLGTTIMNGLNNIMYLINNFFSTTDWYNIGSSVGEMINAGLEAIDPSAWGLALVGKINMLWQTAYGFVSTLDWAALGDTIVLTFTAGLGHIDWNAISGTFINGLNGITTMIAQWPTNFPIQATANKLWGTLHSILLGVDWTALGETFNKLIMQVFHSIDDIDFTEFGEPLGEFLEGLDLAGLIVQYFKTNGEVIVETVCGVLKTQQGWELLGLGAGALIAKGLISALKLQVTGWLLGGGLSEAFTGITQALGGIVSAFAPILAVVGGIGIAIQSLVTQWTDGFSTIQAVITGVGLAIAAVGAVILGAPAAVAAVVAAIVWAISEFVIVIHEHWDEICAWFEEKWQGLCDWFSEKWQGICDWFDEKIGGLKEGWEGLCDKWDETKNNIGDKITEFKDNCGKTWDEAKQAASDWATETGTNLKNTWDDTKKNITDKVTDIKTGISEKWDEITTNLTNSTGLSKTSVLDAFTKLKNGAKDIFEQLKNVIKKPINAIISFINDFMKGITDGLNKLFDTLNKIHISVPSWVPWIGGKEFGFSISHITYNSIPALATGGIVSSPTLAMVGEYSNASSNPEVITPLDKLNGMLHTDETNALLRELITVVDSKDFRAYISKNEVGKASVDYINSQSRILGSSVLKGAY